VRGKLSPNKEGWLRAARDERFIPNQPAANQPTRARMITIVSGIPRSGTSLMMQMIAAGGMAALTDSQRNADANNPRGYYELESVKTLARNPEAIAEAEGKAVKVISSLLTFLPNRYEYRVIFKIRPLDEVLASQDRMMQRLGRIVPPAPAESVKGAFEQHIVQIRVWLAAQPNMAVLYVEYGAVLQDARGEAAKIKAFLGLDLDADAMARQVEQSLYRERAG